MPNYQYTARNSSGKLIMGTLEAESVQLVAQTLHNRGQIPLNIAIHKESEDILQQLAYWQALRSININDLILFSRQMYSLTKAGVPLIRSIHSLADSCRNIALAQALRNIAQRLEAGQSLSQAMSQHPKIFPLLFISIINIGETTGGLEQAFNQISHYLSREKETQGRVKSAFRYPMMVIGAISVAMVIVNIYVIPAFKGVFDRLGSELPWQTRLLMSISDFSVNYWPYILGLLLGMVLVAQKLISTPEGRRKWHWMLLKLPLVGQIVEQAIMERFCRSFAMILSAGVPLIQGIAIVANSVGNDYISYKLQRMQVGIEKGDSISRMAKSIDLFPALVLQMLLVGEESGNISDMLQEAAEYYEGEIDALLKNLSSAIEPILILVIGIMVLILALGIFLPMWNLTSAMH
jgi:MSHA biogenesis protein MshG